MQKIYKCLYCGREFIDKIPHKCSTGYRKHHLTFKNMKQFNVINYNFNAQKFESYDVIPYLINAYKDIVKKHHNNPNDEYWKVPQTFDEFKEFVKKESQYQFWSRCEYEIILVDWPCQKHEEKWDVYDQIMMNLDIVTKLLMEVLEVPCVPE